VGRLFSVLNCRVISAQETVLAQVRSSTSASPRQQCNILPLNNERDLLLQDYNVDCNTSKHGSFQTGSIIMIFLFSLGVPVGLLIGLRFDHISKTKQFNTPAWDWIQRRVMAQLEHSKRRDVKHCIIDLSLGTTYGSLVSAYKPAFFW
jgi:hypothetical protein